MHIYLPLPHEERFRASASIDRAGSSTPTLQSSNKRGSKWAQGDQELLKFKVTLDDTSFCTLLVTRANHVKLY